MVKKSDIRKDLIAQLGRNGVTGSHYIDIIDNYLAFWEIKKKLIADIRARGLIVKWDNGGGQKGERKNESVGELHKVNAQMLKILSDLGLRITAKPVVPEKSDDDNHDDEEM